MNESLLALHAISSNHSDPQVSARFFWVTGQLSCFHNCWQSRAYRLANSLSNSLSNCHKFANCPHSSLQCCDFIETHYLEEQVKSIKEIADYVAQLKRVGNDLGVYIFDREFKS